MRLRLHHRLALPFAVVAVAATAAATWYAAREARRWVDDGRRADAARTAALLERRDYAINPSLLRIAADLTDVEVVTWRRDGVVIASTLADPPADLLAAWRGGARPPTCGASCFVAYAGDDEILTAVMAGYASDSPLSDATVQSIWLAGLVGILLLVGISQGLARVVTARIERLVAFARRVSAEPAARADEGHDDIGQLGSAFNATLDRLEEQRQTLVRTEKLALAGLMAARVAHDIRNPLSSIKMQAQLLHVQAQAGTEQQAMLSAILRDIVQLEAVVSDLLETARPEEPVLAPTRLADLVRQAVEPLRPQLAHRRIALELAVDEEAPPLPVDASRLRRVLANVLSNAAEATRAGGAIHVALQTDASGQVITIGDDGVGIDPEVLPRVFDPFVSAKPGGIGLGLVNAKAIVESHGGRITLAPRQPRGTLVTIQLPYGRHPHR